MPLFESQSRKNDRLLREAVDRIQHNLSKTRADWKDAYLAWFTGARWAAEFVLSTPLKVLNLRETISIDRAFSPP